MFKYLRQLISKFKYPLGRVYESIEQGKLFVVSLGNEADKQGFKLVYELRKRLNCCVVQGTFGKSMKSQMRSASSEKADVLLILGDNELKSGNIVIKNMWNHEQKTIPQSKIVPFVSKMFYA